VMRDFAAEWQRSERVIKRSIVLTAASG